MVGLRHWLVLNSLLNTHDSYMDAVLSERHSRNIEGGTEACFFRIILTMI